MLYPALRGAESIHSAFEARTGVSIRPRPVPDLFSDLGRLAGLR
jgi:hypothetical protein